MLATKTFKYKFWTIFTLSVIFHIVTLYLGKTSLSDWRFIHDPIHSSMEMVGAIVAMFVARMLITQERAGKGTSFNYTISAALLGMGVFDGAHALFHAGKSFVFFHSLATLWGGLTFSLVWFDDYLTKGFKARLPSIVLYLSIAMSIFFILFDDLVPVMAVDGAFTFPAIFMNSVGGALLILASIKLLLCYRKTNAIDDVLFFLHCILFGLAATMFMESKLWDLPWWGWHVLRFVAYITALYFTFLSLKQVDNQVYLFSQLKSLEKAINEHSIVAKTKPNGVITYVNDKLCEISQYSKEELVGKTHKILNSKHHDKQFFKDMWSTIQAGKSWRSNIKNMKKNGDHYWVDTTITPIKDHFDNIVEYIAIRNEITEEVEVQELAEEIQAISKIGGWELDLSTGMTKWTDEVYRIHELEIGTPTSKIEGISYYALHERKKLTDYINKCIQEGTPFDDEFEFVTAKGRRLWVRSIGRPQYVGERIIKLYGTFQDITEAKHKELELQRAKVEAEESKRLKSEFLANMSHEIRTPMNGLLGMLSLLEGPNLTNDQKEMIKVSRSSGESLLTILNDILDVSKIESGKLELEEKSFSLIDSIEDVLSIGRHNAKDKDIEVLFENVDVKNFNFLGDVTRVRQILVNLLSNAIKFTEYGSVKIRTRLEKYSEESSTVVIEVKDTGIGIPRKAHDNLFHAFSQADSSTTRRFGGTGLGLTICNQLVELMHGDLSFISEEGKGTTFFAKIKLKNNPDIEDQRNDSDLNDVSIDKDRHTILIVEDNKINQKVAVRMLGKLGLEADVANNGEEALEIMQNGSYSLIFMDMQMPVMDGIEATVNIRKKYKDEPYIIAMTANAFDEDKQKCFNAGMNDFLAKPIKIDELKKALAKINVDVA